jgi:hypothetical protein
LEQHKLVARMSAGSVPAPQAAPATAVVP